MSLRFLTASLLVLFAVPLSLLAADVQPPGKSVVPLLSGDSAHALAGSLRAFLVDYLPNPLYQASPGWGRMKMVARGVEWKGKGLQEKGVDEKTGDALVEIDERYFRPTEVEFLLGDPGKAKAKLGWTHKTGFDQLVTEMVESDLAQVKREHELYGRTN